MKKKKKKKGPEGDAGYPSALPLLTLTDQVVFPGSAVPLRVANASEQRLINDVAGGSELLGLITLKEDAGADFKLHDAYEVGCIGRLLQIQPLPDNSVTVIIQCLQRFRIEGLQSRKPYITVYIEALETRQRKRKDFKPLVTTLKAQASRLISLSPNIPDGAAQIVDSINDPAFLSDLVAGNLNVGLAEKQELLSLIDLEKRLNRLMYLMEREIEVMETSAKIQREVKKTIDKGQREYFLREQLKAIHQELGDSGSGRPEIEEYREKIAALGLSTEVGKEIERELNRLSQMQESSAEYHVLTTYLDWVVDLPWSVSTGSLLKINRAEEILNEDHYGLEKVKRRILDHLAVRKLKKDAGGAVICFAGPPGVGKTSLGKSIARALNREFVRISLGGIRDEAEIRGHRRTYVGAMPGRIIQSLRKAESNNPVFLLDEIDKLGADFRGDPSAALLEVLDPAQNNSFTDHYLHVPFDLSKVMFIATANVLDTIPWALRDRMELIEIPGYTLEEKLKIARKYLVPRQIEAHGIPPRKLTFSVAALRTIIAQYTREAGVRNLEREIANVCRSSARAFTSRRRKPIAITPDTLKAYLGNPKVYYDSAERARMPGVATGLAWTPTGGDILYIEATRMPGKGQLILTGQLGDVMKESAQTVLSYIRANAGRLGLAKEDFGDYDIHIHVPQGAVPKDGPSAGVALLAAVTSMLLGKRVKNRLAMTGEITLRGLVLPVGGVKEKVLAAVRAGIKEIILPARCENDLDDVPDTAKNKVKFHFVTEMNDVLAIALGLE
jgi:ATP-dependent Lon protease